MRADQKTLEGFEPKRSSPLSRKKSAFTPDIDELLKPHKTIQVAAAGSVLITKLETDIIDTAAFQRLRRVRQLGSACLVFTTAVHTRFDHSLGTLNVATEMTAAIRDNMHSTEPQRNISKEQMLIIRLYALLHDITHVPFGHTIEDELSLLTRHDKNRARIEYFLGPKSEIGKIIISRIGLDLFHRLHEVYMHGSPTPGVKLLPFDWYFVQEIVSNTVCADLLDYLRRDDYFCDLGIRMRYRFLNFLYIHGNGTREDPRRLVIRLYKNTDLPRRDTLSDLCRLLESRYMIAERVYYHHAKIAAGAMIGLAIQEHVGGRRSGAFERQIRTLGDDELISELIRSRKKTASEIALAYRERRLFKTLDVITMDQVESARSHVGDRDRDLLALISQLATEPSLRAQIISRYASILGVPAHHLTIYVPPERMGHKPAEMLVSWKGGLRPFKEIDDEHVKPRLDAVDKAHARLRVIVLLGHASLRDTEKAKWFSKLFRAEYVSPTEEQAVSESKDVLGLVAEELVSEHFAEQPLSHSNSRLMKERMIEAAFALYHNGSSEIRTRMLEEGRQFIDEHQSGTV